MNRILEYPEANRLLRQKAKKVKNPQSTEAILCVQAMKRLALEWEQHNPGEHVKCAGLAATQIGVPLRIIIIRNLSIPKAPQNPLVLTSEQILDVYGDIHEDMGARYNYFSAIAAHEEWSKTARVGFDPFLVMYNPVYHTSEGMQDSEEGCLSVPCAHGLTIRPEKSTFHYYDQNLKRCPPRDAAGNETFYEAVGYPSSVICHELDHLQGVLFVDAAFKLWRPGSKDKPLQKYEEGCDICGDLYCECLEAA